MNSVAQAVLNTITYGSLFDFPLRASELHKYLIFTTPVSFKATEETLGDLISQRLVEKEADVYFLPGRKTTVQERARREKISRDKIKDSEKIIKVISRIPWVKMVGLTGDLSYGNGTDTSDVDLMVITDVERMWLTRLITFSFLEIFGIKMKGGPYRAGTRICINVWCDESNLAIPESEHDLVLASDVSHLVPVVSKDGTYEKFIQSNLI